MPRRVTRDYSCMPLSTPPDPAVAALRLALEQQSAALSSILTDLAAAQDSHLPRASGFWAGIAERAQAGAVDDLAGILAAGVLSVRYASSNTTHALAVMGDA
jgi:hypothetical protein